MKETGIIRRIDDLGRIVIPRDIRNKYGIKAGDPLEICLEDKSVLLKPNNEDNPKEVIAKSGQKILNALDELFYGEENDDDYQLAQLLIEKIIAEYGS